MKNENIIRDMATGVLVADKTGQITLMNGAVSRLFPLLGSCKSLTQAIEIDSENSDFYDLIIDSAMHRNNLEAKVLEYNADGEKKYYDVHSTYIEDEESVIVSVVDVTKEVLYGRRAHDGTVVAAGIISFMALWNIIYAVWKKYFPGFGEHMMTIVLIALGCVISYLLLRLTDLKQKDMGLEIREKKKEILFSAAVTAGILAFMVLLKFLFFRKNGQMFDFSVFRQVSTMYYPLTVFVQEILSRGIMHNALEKVFTSKNSSHLAILVSSLAFAGLHIHLGLMFMLGAGLLLCVFGFIYEKQRSIWALCIPHYCLCVAAQILGFM